MSGEEEGGRGVLVCVGGKGSLLSLQGSEGGVGGRGERGRGGGGAVAARSLGVCMRPCRPWRVCVCKREGKSARLARTQEGWRWREREARSGPRSPPLPPLSPLSSLTLSSLHSLRLFCPVRGPSPDCAPLLHARGGPAQPPARLGPPPPAGHRGARGGRSACGRTAAGGCAGAGRRASSPNAPAHRPGAAPLLLRIGGAGASGWAPWTLPWRVGGDGCRVQPPARASPVVLGVERAGGGWVGGGGGAAAAARAQERGGRAGAGGS